MKTAISGASGLVGQALAEHLRQSSMPVLRLVRGAAQGADEIPWDPAAGKLDPGALAACDAVVNLSGENIASGPWSPELKRRILASRIQSTRTIVDAMAAASPRPGVLINASAIGFYGNTGDHAAEEESPAGTGFLAEVCQAWEDEARRAEALGVRVVRLRIGIVLSTRGGMLGKMLLPTRFGLGAQVGDGSQHISWITLPDLVRAVHFCLSNSGISGAVNAVSPTQVTNAEFTRTLAAVLHRPALLRVPALVLRAALGEMADEMLLTSCRVRPRVLEEHHFDYEDPTLNAALRRLLRENL